MNLQTLDWDAGTARARSAFREQMLPRIASSSEVYGEATLDAVKGVPVAGILGDQQAALVGQTCFHAGEAKNTYGTGCFLLMNTGTKPVQSQHGLLTTVAYQFGGQPARVRAGRQRGDHRRAGAVDARQLRADRKERGDRGAGAHGEGQRRRVFRARRFRGLYAPYWKDNARGVIAGLTRYTNKGHLARAVLEATAFQTREVVEAMEKDAGIPLRCAAHRWRHGGERSADAVPGGYPGPAGGASGGARRPRRWARRTPRGSRWDFSRISTTCAARWCGGSDLEAADGRGAARASCMRFWKKAVTRSFDWL